MSDSAMVPCDHVIAKLWEYLDGSLDQIGSDEVSRHIDICSRCFPEYDFRRAYLTFMKRCKSEEVPVALRKQIFAMVLAEENGGAARKGVRGLFGGVRDYLRRGRNN